MTNHAVSNRADLRELSKTMSRRGDRRGQIADFWDSFETINWLYLLFKCGIKTKSHFQWLFDTDPHALGQLNLEPTRPNGLSRGLQSANWSREDLSVKEATHMGFYYKIHWRFPCRARTMPVPALHLARMESCELFDQTMSVQSCQAVRGP